MIQTLTKNLLIICHHPCTRKKWYPINDMDIDWGEFSGATNNQGVTHPNDDYSRIIDSFEYVIRFQPFRYFGKSRGHKTDIVLPPTPYTLNTSWFKKTNHPHQKIYEYFKNLPSHLFKEERCGGLYTRFGLPEYCGESNKEVTTSDIDYGYTNIMYEHGEYFNNFFEKGYNSTNEYWIPITWLYGIIFFGSHKKEKLLIHRLFDYINFIEESFGINIKYMGIDDYFFLRDEVSKFSLSVKDAYDLVSETKWFQTVDKLNEDGKRLKVKLISSIRERFLKELSTKPSKYLNKIYKQNSFSRGLEAIYMAIKDTRFSSHKKYIVGFMNIISKTPLHHIFEEYLIVTKWLDNKYIVFFPEHAEYLRGQYSKIMKKFEYNLFNDYTDVTLSKGMNIHCEK